jgi:hypothetical protein
MKKLLISLLLALGLVGLAFANGSQTASVITQVQTSSANTYFAVFFGGTNTTPAACATTTNGFAVDPTTSIGAAAMTAALAQYALGKKVTVAGTGSCINGIEIFSNLYNTN